MRITGRGTRQLLRSAAVRLARPDGHGRGALVAYGALSAVDLLATARSRTARGPARAAKPLLMPALLSHTLRRRLDRDEPLPAPLLAGLGCATVGDTALLLDDREKAMYTGIAAFLGTQLSYTVGMARLGGLDGIRRNPRPAVGCLAAWVAVNAALAPALPPRMRLPAAGYSLALTAMTAVALGLGGKVAVGAVLFLASDLLIGAQQAGVRLPADEVLVMAGYIVGQYLIATGWDAHTP
ncbi:lysoplasmalogenase [Streptomyces sp. AJS327]|uniref:lysoplasmalogenase n=1 Tax=Streptomyces sp. AJS327 TaxID=2545265 RepID=UPI0015DE9A74|nr:lysoplasmalogenase [Streptomyces sp. AJS327]MBA0049410.1 lysoplasmalogenase [Streptomyces sp. AJS327]